MLVNLSDYDGDIVSGDSSPALEAAIADVIATGGKINIDKATLTLKSEAAFAQVPYAPVPFLLQGDGSNVIKIDAPGLIAITSSNLGMTFRDLIFRANNTSGSYVDCANAFYFGNAQELKFENTKIYGIRASDSVLKVQVNQPYLYMDTCRVSGCYAPNGVVSTSQGAPVYMNNVIFHDLCDLGSDVSFGKVQNSGSWIQLRRGSAPPSTGAVDFARAELNNMYFDEGIAKTIDIDGYDRVEINKAGILLGVGSGSIGIHLKNVAYAVLKYVHAGHATYDVPIVKLENCGEVVIIGMTRTGAAHRVVADSASYPNVRIIDSPGVNLIQQS